MNDIAPASGWPFHTLHDLRTDHANVARLLELLSMQLEILLGHGSPDYGLMGDVMHYVTNYPDLFHHPKEDLVFDKLKARDTGIDETLDALVVEHRAILHSGNDLVRALRDAEYDPCPASRDRVEVLGWKYVGDLRRHMMTEDRDVFPVAETKLGPRDWAEIEARVETREDPLFGGIVAKHYGRLYAHIVRMRR